MVTFAVAQDDAILQNQQFADMYELLAYVSSYVHTKTQQQNQLAKKLEQIKLEESDWPFTVEEAKAFLDIA